MEVTAEVVRKALADSTMRTIQPAVSLPILQRFVNRLEAGSAAPPIIVDEGVIVDGNHRYAAGRVFGRDPEIRPGTLPESQQPNVRSVQRLRIDPRDWDNP